jgi:hypothetical protein
MLNLAGFLVLLPFFWWLMLPYMLVRAWVRRVAR